VSGPDIGLESALGKPEPPVRLSVRDLRVCLAEKPAVGIVEEVTFEVPAGELLGLVGESGSGKTTVALSLMGHARRGLKIASGSIALDEVELTTLPRRAIRELRGSAIAYVPQDPASALNPALRIDTQLTEVMTAHPEAHRNLRRRKAEVLEDVRLSPELLGRYPHQLSGGQQQRVGLAMAFVCRPRLIVFDEPTTGLDVSTQRHILTTIRNLCSNYGVAAVYVSHDLSVVGGLVSQVAVMYSGRIIEHGEIAEVFGHPVHPYTRGLLAAVPSAERAELLHGIEGQPPRPDHRPKGCSFAPRCRLRVAQCDEAPPVSVVAGREVRCWQGTESVALPPGRPDVAAVQNPLGMAALRLSDVGIRYGANEVLRQVSLEVAAKSCTAIVGESGAGKTALARAVVGLNAHFSGSIEFGGEKLAGGVRHRPKDVLRRIQYVSQNPYTSLNPRKTVGQILGQTLERFFKLPFDTRVERVEAVLRDVSLAADFAARYPDQLSGGERQRVAIARALIVEPELLVCDEVSSALDVSVQAVIIELLRRLQAERHLTMIFITHNIALVRSIAQSVAVLADGAIVEIGPVDDVLERPRDPYTVSLMADVPRISAAP
jgi:peptide/nickel transport system ATP-binding protein